MLLGLYHKLPPAARTLVASLHGYYLQSLRYSADTSRLVEMAIEQESWGPERWVSWQQEELGRLLDRARTQVAFYREHWAERRRRGDNSSWELLENWPILEKAALRENPRAFIAEDCKEKLYLVQTSGTTGTPLQLWQSKKTLIAWYALVEARSRNWYGVSKDDRWAILGGKLVAPVGQTRPPFWVWNRGMQQLYLSSYHLSPSWIPQYLRALSEYRVSYLWGYTSALYTLAEEIAAQKLTPPKLKVIITNAEPVYDYQREAIESAFGCPVRQTYGMAEMAAAAGECDAGTLHLWPSVGVTEVLENGGPAAAGKPGELVCTGLVNSDMPLIRYRVGDRGAISMAQDVCRCGRRLPALASLEGRMDDVLYTVDGRRIGRLDPILKGTIPVRELQFIQETLGSVLVRYVPAPGFDFRAEQALRDRIRQYVGELEIELETVRQIPRGANGKFRMVVSKLPQNAGLRAEMVKQVARV